MSRYEQIEVINISIPGYSEQSTFFPIIEKLKTPYRTIEISESTYIKAFPEAIEKLGLPIDCGSLITTYLLLKESNDILFVGETADTLFLPTFRGHIEFLNGNRTLKELLLKMSKSEQITLFPSSFDLCFNLKEIFYEENKILSLLKYELKSVFPYWDIRYRLLSREKQTVYLPYANLNTFKLTLSMQDLHNVTFPSKIFLRFIAMSKWGDILPQNLFLTEKKPFIRNKTLDYLIIDEYFDPELLEDTKIFRKDLDWDKFNTHFKYFGALLSIWLRILYEKV